MTRQAKPEHGDHLSELARERAALEAQPSSAVRDDRLRTLDVMMRSLDGSASAGPETAGHGAPKAKPERRPAPTSKSDRTARLSELFEELMQLESSRKSRHRDSRLRDVKKMILHISGCETVEAARADHHGVSLNRKKIDPKNPYVKKKGGRRRQEPSGKARPALPTNPTFVHGGHPGLGHRR